MRWGNEGQFSGGWGPPRGGQWNDRREMQQPWVRAPMNQFAQQRQGVMTGSVRPPAGKCFDDFLFRRFWTIFFLKTSYSG